jgi:hypothetical protein
MSVKFPAPDLPPAMRRMIHGIASTERVVDVSRSSDGSDNSVLLARGCELTVPVPLLCRHIGDAIGEVIHLRWIGTKLYCRAVVFDNAGGRRAWQKIEGYKLRGLSCGFEGGHYQTKLREDVGIIKEYDRYRIKEIFLCHEPANIDCYFAIFSGGLEGRVAGMRSVAEHRRITARARALLARSASEKKKSPSSRPNLSAEGLSRAERRRFDDWYKKSLGDGGDDP